MQLEETIQALERLVPPAYAEAWDNTGLLVRPLHPRPIQRVLLTIDLVEGVVDEAQRIEADLIIAYHPILFRGAKQLDASRAHDRMVMKLVQADLAVYSPHTALDAAADGVNDWLARGVGEGSVTILQPIPGTNAGQGRLVTLHSPIALQILTERVKKHLNLEQIRVAVASDNRPIRTIALCAGAGTDAFAGVEADCFLTGEMGHHHILAATQNGAHVVLCEHTNTERGYLPIFAEKLADALGNGIDIAVSEMDADPIKFN